MITLPIALLAWSLLRVIYLLQLEREHPDRFRVHRMLGERPLRWPLIRNSALLVGCLVWLVWELT